MTPDRAREIIKPRPRFGGGYSCKAARLILGELAHEHGQGAVDALIDLDQAFGRRPGTDSFGVGR